MMRLLSGWRRKKPALKSSFLQLEGDRVILRPGLADDWRAWAELRARSRGHLVPFEPEWTDDCLTKEFFLRRLARQARDRESGSSCSFLIFQHDGVILGGINLNNIVYGAARFGSFGYWLGEEHQGHGYMAEAARVLTAYAFNDLNLHRINAATLGHNGRSIRLLRRLRFEEEGFARNYIRINGEWQDHILFGLTAERYRGLSLEA
jgi:ribosomal-protein-alanine N-acetyltransferase